MATPVEDRSDDATLVARLRSCPWVLTSALILTLGAGASGCASSSGYQALPGSTATAEPANEGLSPAEQQKIIDDLKAAKAKSEQQAAAQ